MNVVSLAFVINVIKWLMWTVETMYQAGFIIPFWCETLVKTPSKHDVDLMLSQRWPNIKPALVQRLVFAGRSTQ